MHVKGYLHVHVHMNVHLSYVNVHVHVIVSFVMCYLPLCTNECIKKNQLKTTTKCVGM